MGRGGCELVYDRSQEGDKCIIIMEFVSGRLARSSRSHARSSHPPRYAPLGNEQVFYVDYGRIRRSNCRLRPGSFRAGCSRRTRSRSARFDSGFRSRSAGISDVGLNLRRLSQWPDRWYCVWCFFTTHRSTSGMRGGSSCMIIGLTFRRTDRELEEEVRVLLLTGPTALLSGSHQSVPNWIWNR
jgi:hypothetical protein